MGNQAAAMLGMEGVPISVEESLAGMMKVVSTFCFEALMQCNALDLQVQRTDQKNQIDTATRDSTSGKFMVYNGEEGIW